MKCEVNVLHISCCRFKAYYSMLNRSGWAVRGVIGMYIGLVLLTKHEAKNRLL